MTTRLGSRLVQDKTNGYGSVDIPIIAFPETLRRGRDREDASAADGEINRVTGIAPVMSGPTRYATIAAVLTPHRPNCVPNWSFTDLARPG